MARPRKFETPEQLQELIDKYFEEDCPTRILYSNGNPYTVKTPTISGLSLYVGFCDRHAFYDYEKYSEFSHTIKAARARITSYYEENTQVGSPAGSIFMLKNLGYTDKQEFDVNAKVTKMEKIKVDGKELDFDIGEGSGTTEITGHTGEIAEDS